MAVQNFRKRWSIKPPVGAQLNWGNPTTTGLIGCWAYNEQGGLKLNNLARNSIATIGSTPSAPWKVGSQGPNVLSNLNNIATEAYPSIGFPFSIVVIANVTAIATRQNVFFSHDNNTTGAGYRIRTETNGNLNLILAGAGGSQIFTSCPVVGNGVWHFIGVTAAAASGAAVAYVAPIGTNLKTQTLTLTSGIAGTPSQVCLGGIAASTAFSGGAMALAFFWKRVLTPGEMQRLNIDPYAMFMSQSPRHRQNFGPMTSFIDAPVLQAPPNAYKQPRPDVIVPPAMQSSFIDASLSATSRNAQPRIPNQVPVPPISSVSAAIFSRPDHPLRNYAPRYDRMAGGYLVSQYGTGWMIQSAQPVAPKRAPAWLPNWFIFRAANTYPAAQVIRFKVFVQRRMLNAVGVVRAMAFKVFR